MTPNPQTIDALTRAGEAGPFVAIFVLLALLMVVMMGGFLYLGARVVRATERTSDSIATLSSAMTIQSDRIGHMDTALDGIRSDVREVIKNAREAQRVS